MELSILENLRMVQNMALVSTTGQINHATKVNGEIMYSKVKESITGATAGDM